MNQVSGGKRYLINVLHTASGCVSFEQSWSTTGKQTPPDKDLGQMDRWPSGICESDPSATYWHQ